MSKINEFRKNVMYFETEVNKMAKTIEEFINDHADKQHQIDFKNKTSKFSQIMQLNNRNDGHAHVMMVNDAIENVFDIVNEENKDNYYDAMVQEAMNTMVIPFYKEVINEFDDILKRSKFVMNDSIVSMPQLKKLQAEQPDNKYLQTGKNRLANINVDYPVYIELRQDAMYPDDPKFNGVFPVTNYTNAGSEAFLEYTSNIYTEMQSYLTGAIQNTLDTGKYHIETTVELDMYTGELLSIDITQADIDDDSDIYFDEEYNDSMTFTYDLVKDELTTKDCTKIHWDNVDPELFNRITKLITELKN